MPATGAVMTTKGQLTLPKELRDRLGLIQGDVVEFIEEDGKVVVRRAQSSENPFVQWAEAGVRNEATAPDPVDWLRDLRGWDDTDRELFR
jgi:AbrB family looped-hinge helix DNA binding protein